MKNTNFLITFASVLSLAVISSGAFNQPVSAGAARKAATAGIIANAVANQNTPPVVYQNTVPTTSVSASTAVTPNQNNQSAVYQNTMPTTSVSAPAISAPGSAPSPAPVTKQSVDAGSHSLEEKDVEEIIKKAYSEWSSKEKNSGKKGGKLSKKLSKKQSKSQSTEKDSRQKKGAKPADHSQKTGEKAPAA